MCGGGGRAPTPPAAVPEAPVAPEVRTGEGVRERDLRRRRAAAGGEASRSTILTSSRGVQDGGAVAQKPLFGS
jgi:hypothetical protein